MNKRFTEKDIKELPKYVKFPGKLGGAQAKSAEAAKEREKAREVISLILPLAKGYVAKNDVGSNQKYIEVAEDYLDEEKTTCGKPHNNAGPDSDCLECQVIKHNI